MKKKTKRSSKFKAFPSLPVLLEKESSRSFLTHVKTDTPKQDMSVSRDNLMSISPDSTADSGIGIDDGSFGVEQINGDIKESKFNVKSKEMPKRMKTDEANTRVKKQRRSVQRTQDALRRKMNERGQQYGAQLYPDINIPNLSPAASSFSHSGKEGQILIPSSKIDRRATIVRNTMYGNFLRQSTKKLQDDLRQTMRTYSTEKQQLLRHLASLRHEMDELRLSNTTSPTSTLTDRSSYGSESGHHSKARRYYMAPNIAAHKLKKKKKKENGQKASPKADNKEDRKPKDGILKLPSIQEGSTNTTGNRRSSEWDSGEHISLTNLPPIDPPPGIAAAQALLQNSYKMPNTEDPDRTDINIDSTKPSGYKDREKKKVQFSENDQINVITPCHNAKFDSPDQNSSGVSKNFVSENIKISPRTSKGKNYHLPPLDLAGKKSLTPRETEDHKMMYISIKDPEVRTKTLSEILHAVRVRMQENEQHMKYFGTTPPRKMNNTYEFLVSSSMDRYSPIPRSESQRSKASSRLSGPQHTAARLGRRSNAAQLQNYLKKMSKSRRMIEHMEAEEYRLAHYMGHKELLAVSKTSSPLTIATT